MNAPNRKLVVGCLVAFIVVAATIVYHVWPPDVFHPREVVAGTYLGADGTSFRLTQRWNQIDFYSTYLSIERPSGETRCYQLDGDDKKRWVCRFKPDARGQRLAVFTDFDERCDVDLGTLACFRNGHQLD